MANAYRYNLNDPGAQGSSHQNQQGGPDYHYDYGYHPNPGTPQPPKNSGRWGDWIGMGVLFLLPFFITKLVSVVWFVRKIRSMSRAEKEAYRQEARRAADQVKDTVINMGADFFENARKVRQGQHENPGQSARSDQNARVSQGQSQSRNDSRNIRICQEQARTKVHKETAGGKRLMIAGGLMTGVFGLATISELEDFFEALYYGFFDDDLDVLLLAILMAAGVVVLCAGIGKRRRAQRYFNYLGYIGANREVSLSHMANTFGVSNHTLCKDLRRMLSKGLLPTGYLDLAEGKLFLTEMGYRQSERWEKSEQEKDPGKVRESDLLQQIRQINSQIPDEVMSSKINRIEEITGKILAYQKTHPDRDAQLRSFLNYYLPTTLKILRAYAQLDAQGIEGENISATKTRIEGMMDQVVAGFEKQLDRLFRDDAMDITSDVEVLENMLKKDGLFDDGMSMTM